MIGSSLRNATLAAVLVVHGFASGYQSEAVRIAPRPAPAETPRETPEIYERIDTALVLVPVQATRADQPVLDLRADQFRIFENGQQEQIRYFSQDDAPVSVGLLWDSSGSMKYKERRAADAASAFFRTANPADEFFLVTFDESARVVTGFVEDTARVSDGIRHTRPFGRTSLFDAVQLGLETMKRAKHRRKALLILSDGNDNRSRRSFASIKNSALESDVQIYSVSVYDTPRGSLPPEAESGAMLLSQLAGATGGRHFQVDFSDLEETAERLGRLMRSEYVLGYTPSDSQRDGTYRKITVEMVPSAGPIALTYRRGYYAPTR